MEVEEGGWDPVGCWRLSESYLATMGTSMFLTTSSSVLGSKRRETAATTSSFGGSNASSRVVGGIGVEGGMRLLASRLDRESGRSRGGEEEDDSKGFEATWTSGGVAGVESTAARFEAWMGGMRRRASSEMVRLVRGAEVGY